MVLAVLLLQMIANAFGLMHMSDNAKTFANGCPLIAALVPACAGKREAQKGRGCFLRTGARHGAALAERNGFI